MWRYILFIVLAGAGAMYYSQGNFSLTQAYQGLSSQLSQQAASPAPTIYRWRDAQGGVHYGSKVPPGVKAVVADQGSLNTLEQPMPSPAPAPDKKAAPAEGEKTIQQMATERAIEQATQ